ncbi:MAG: insulinase family protein [Acidobacteria bacterium]|nr:insulinase family protein [Acidobacteriota bacterium]
MNFNHLSKSRSRLVAVLLVASLSGFAPATLFAQGQPPPLPKGISRVTSVEGITEYALENGLRVLLFPDPSQQTITVNITYLVGSRHEGYGETGMAHLLEHLVFKGTPKHPNIPQELTEHGASPNGSTWTDRTNYFETFAANEENLRWALDLEADRMTNSYIAKKDLDSEMTVVRNEFEMNENEPTAILEERVTATAYLWHNYGKSTIGARSDIEKVPIQNLQAFYHKYYQPDNAVLLVAGKFDEAKTLGLVNQYFAPLARPTRQLQATHTDEPTQDGERTVTLRRVGDVQAVCAAYHIPAGSHPDFAAVQVLTYVLGNTPSGRLHKALVETKKASSVGGESYQFRDPSLAIFQAEVRQESSLDEARDTLLKTIEGIAANPPTTEEVARARTALLKIYDLILRAPDRVGLVLSEWMGMGDWRLFFLHRDRLRKVTPEEVQRVAAAYLKTSNRTLGLFIPTAKPDRAEIPATPDIAAALKDYKGEAVIAAGEAFDPSPANIEARTTRTNAGALKLALLPKKTRGNTVVASLTLHFGDEKSLTNRATAAQFVGGLLRRGTAKHTRQQIKDEFDKLKAQVAVNGGATSATVFMETTREHFPAALKLVAEMLREPIFPEAEFEQLKQSSLAQIEAQRSDPTATAVTALRRHLYPYPKGDVRYVATPEEEAAAVKALTLDAVKNFYRDFYGASNGELAVVGDFEAKEVEQLTTALFGNWKNPKPYARLAEAFQEIAPQNEELLTPDKANAFFIAAQRLNLRDDAPDFPALVLANEILGGGFLNSRIVTRLRQKDGLSYGAGSELHADSLDQNGAFLTYAIYAPQNVAKLENGFKEEMMRALKDGFSAEEVAAAKAGYLQAQQRDRADDGGLARTLATYLFLHRTLAWDEAMDKNINALTVEQVNAALRRYVDVSKMTIIKAGDFAKSATK